MTRAASVPALLLAAWALLPMPGHAPVEAFLCQGAAQLAAAFLRALGVPVACAAHTLWSDAAVLDVVAACSGLRKAGALCALAAALGTAAGTSRRRGLALLVLALVLALLTNAARVALAFGLLARGLPEAEARHQMAGLLLFGVAAALLAVTARCRWSDRDARVASVSRPTRWDGAVRSASPRPWR